METHLFQEVSGNFCHATSFESILIKPNGSPRRKGPKHISAYVEWMNFLAAVAQVSSMNVKLVLHIKPCCISGHSLTHLISPSMSQTVPLKTLVPATVHSDQGERYWCWRMQLIKASQVLPGPCQGQQSLVLSLSSHVSFCKVAIISWKWKVELNLDSAYAHTAIPLALT